MANLGYETYRSEWLDHTDLKDTVAELCVGDTLVLPSGRSPLGDVRADVDATVAPDIIADLKHPPFKHQSFDTVYCDPPYSMFDFGKSTEWVKELYKIARKRLIIQGVNKKISVGMPADTELYLLNPKSGSSKHWIRTLQVFTRPDAPLSTFS